MHYDEDEFGEEKGIYSRSKREAMIDDDQLSAEEEAFMNGYSEDLA